MTLHKFLDLIKIWITEIMMLNGHNCMDNQEVYWPNGQSTAKKALMSHFRSPEKKVFIHWLVKRVVKRKGTNHIRILLPGLRLTHSVRANALAMSAEYRKHTHRLRWVSQTAAGRVLVSCPIVPPIDSALFQSLIATRTFWLSSFYLLTKTRPEPQHRNIKDLERSIKTWTGLRFRATALNSHWTDSCHVTVILTIILMIFFSYEKSLFYFHSFLYLISIHFCLVSGIQQSICLNNDVQ